MFGVLGRKTAQEIAGIYSKSAEYTFAKKVRPLILHSHGGAVHCLQHVASAACAGIRHEEGAAGVRGPTSDTCAFALLRTRFRAGLEGRQAS